jgi:hypothetical protein
MAQHNAHRRDLGKDFLVAFCALAALAAKVDGYSMPLASDPTNVRNQWELPSRFGGVTIPGTTLTHSLRYGYGDDDEKDTGQILYSPLQPVDDYSQDDEEYGGYEAFWTPRSRSTSLLSLAASPPSPLSTGSVWRSNNLNSRRGRSFARSTPALAMANYLQNSDRGNGNNRNNNNYNNNNNNNNRDYNNNYNNNNRDYNNNRENYNSNNYNRDNYDYDDRDRNTRGRGSYDNDRYGPPSRGSQPRGTNRFNTIGSVGNVNGSNASREGRSMQFQNRQDSNIAGRSGRMIDDSYNQFAPDSNSRFQSRSPNDNYARGGYRQDSRTGHWTDPNSNYNINDSGQHSSSSRSSSSSGFRPVPPGDYVSIPEVRGPRGYERGRVGAGGNVPYDNEYYGSNNYESQDYYDYNGDSDYYSRNGNIMDNRRGSRGGRGTGGPGMDDNYYNVDYRDSNGRMDRGGGLMRYRPNNQRAGGGYYGSGDDYEVGGYDEYYDSSGSFYNSEGKRVRRFDRYSDRPEGYYNPEHLSNEYTDPDRMIQNQRRRDGRDVQNGAYLRRYDPEWDGRQGLYDEASLYRNGVKSTSNYANGYGDNMDSRIVGRGRRRGNSESPSVLDGGWGETGGRRNRYPMSSSSRYQDYQDGDYIDDRYDNGDYDNRGRRGGTRRGLGRRDVDGERDYYRSGDYRGPDLRGDESMERFRQGKDVRKTDLYAYETSNTPSNKKRIRRGKSGRVKPIRSAGEDIREGRTVNGSYNAPASRGRRRDSGGRINGSAGRDRGMSLDDLNEML